MWFRGVGEGSRTTNPVRSCAQRCSQRPEADGFGPMAHRGRSRSSAPEGSSHGPICNSCQNLHATLIPARRPRRGLRSGFLATSYSGANLIVPGRVDVLFRGSRRDCHTSRGRHGLPVKIGRTKGVFALGAYQPSACRVYRALHNKDQKTLDSRSSLRAILILALQNHSWAPRLVMSAAHPERRRSCQ